MTETFTGASPEIASPDVAALAAGLGTALHAAGLPVGPDRCERLARAVTVMNVRSVAELRACALATLVSDPSQMTTFERVFALLFGGPNPFKDLPLPTAPGTQRHEENSGPPPETRTQADQDGWLAGTSVSGSPSGACAAVTSPSSPRPNYASWST